eukprot:4010732-Lingulodinium_polyedra.AAC.1
MQIARRATPWPWNARLNASLSMPRISCVQKCVQTCTPLPRRSAVSNVCISCAGRCAAVDA